MAEKDPTAGNADGANAPETKTEVDTIPVDTTAAIDASAKPAPAADAAADTSSAAAPAADADASDKRKPERLPKWAEDLVAESKFEAREANRRAKEAEDKLAAASKPTTDPAKPNEADAAAARDNAPQGGYQTQADFEAAVAAEATKREAAARAAEAENAFNAACNEAYNKGKSAFNDDFDVAVGNLQQLGMMNRDVLDIVLETADPAKVLFELGRDPEKAAALKTMTPARRALEIANLSQPAQKKPTQISKAPAPVPQLDGSARVNAAPSDADDDDTFFAKREAELREAGRW